MGTPETRYTRSGDVNIAYQVFGEGRLDLVYVMGWVTNLEAFWQEPSVARFFQRLASFSRLILFDKRGTGLSDRVPIKELPTLEQRMDDVRAVMDAAGSDRAALFGVSEGGPMCALFAATYPERTSAMVLYGSYAKRLRDPNYPWAPTREERDSWYDLLERGWGGVVDIGTMAPNADPHFREWWARYLRMSASPGAALALGRMNAEIDIREVLPSIRVPTLILHRTGDLDMDVGGARYMASRIAGAKYIELPGDDHLPSSATRRRSSMRSRSSLRGPVNTPSSTASWPPSSSPTWSDQPNDPPPLATNAGATCLRPTTGSCARSLTASAAVRLTPLATASSPPLTDPLGPSAAPARCATSWPGSGSTSELGCTRGSASWSQIRSAGSRSTLAAGWHLSPGRARCWCPARSKTWSLAPASSSKTVACRPCGVYLESGACSRSSPETRSSMRSPIFKGRLSAATERIAAAP